jgi:hypothetical protein
VDDQNQLTTALDPNLLFLVLLAHLDPSRLTVDCLTSVSSGDSLR